MRCNKHKGHHLRRIATVAVALAVMLSVMTESPAGEIPPEITANSDAWPLPNRDYANTRADLKSSISSGNVSQLQVTWSFELTARDPGRFGVAATGPVIVDDTVYVQDLQSNVFAIDLVSGQLQLEDRHDSPTLGPNGATVGFGKLFFAGSQRQYGAFDLETGQPAWNVNLRNGQAALAPPVPYDDTLYVGISASDAGATGAVRALDARTGAVLWNFDTVLSEDLWGHPEINRGGSVWFPPAIDTERGIVYAGTGNPYPFPGTGAFPNGTSRPGANLYTNSMVALNHQTGELKWFDQVVPHDLFDLDFAVPPVLATVEINGQDRDIVIGSGKLGRVLAFDRDTGTRIWDTPVGVHLNDDLTELPPGETVVYPGSLGGVLTPLAYAEGVVFAPVINRGDRYTPSRNLTMTPINDAGPINGELTAIAADSGVVLWSTEFDSMVIGGATVVSDLVFTSTLDGLIYALDRTTGEELWKYQAPGGINAWPAVAGDTIVFPVGIQTGQEPPQLIAFSTSAVPEPSGLILAGLAVFFAYQPVARRLSRGPRLASSSA